MQITKTEYNKEILEKWRAEGKTEEEITELFNQYVKSYGAVIRNKTQKVHFENYVKGLMSALDRKSIEPIALASTGEKGVRPMQQFITRSTFDDNIVLQEYQKMLGNGAASKNGMLSTDGSDFIKKGKNSAGVGRQYCGRYGKTENCQAGVFCAYAGENGYGWDEIFIPEGYDITRAEMTDEDDKKTYLKMKRLDLLRDFLKESK